MNIATLTLNPALDKSTSIDKLQPEKKLRCEEPNYEPGGGGINVSRAIHILGGESLAIYAAGGPAGNKIEELLKQERTDQYRIHVENPTRENLMVMEKTTGNQYRFGMPGGNLDQEELRKCIDAVHRLPGEIKYLVASGSLPPGVPDDFYGTIAEIAKNKNIKCVVDTSGQALIKAAEMGVCIMKPNLAELSTLAGKKTISGLEQEEIAKKIISEGKAETLIVSLGARGAMVVTETTINYVVPPTVKQESTVGAGDSMVAGIVLSLSRGDDLQDAVKWGVAAGTAATMTPGTELCRKKDVEKIFRWLKEKETTDK
ncbi:1-phosphofructokinase family hexose kinase [Sinomicrobium pectinilyticum]|uniref:1-phosphofructokinase family hexose kinase n=1 Tax=Sinomicrobium pectinilyticum TaxID=1084421 RepID=A0A3N0F374_SINP1|nr:1-phosphofructokinase family hexose kinase [Sinomicrobium pectinilyticum]RNL94521.1 1-phosphofructokinase family hexose kinase [Sinomicrobium pectinilyticum]